MRRAEGKGQRAKGRVKFLALCPLLFALSACRPAPSPTPTARNLVLITIDTLRADRVGAYGWTRARTPSLDSLARDGALFERAYAAAPITLPSHATILTGRYPPGHGARDNGLRVSESVPTLATRLRVSGLQTAAFVAAFPLDHQFGLARGFDVYSDRMPRGSDGRLANERPAPQVVDEAIGWLSTLHPTPDTQHGTQPSAPSTQHPFFLWVHLFEPHAPYGDPGSGRSTSDRYDDEIATADLAIGRLLTALAPVRGETLVVAAGDHGEAFGEHGEFAHSIFVYDTTLRVPLLMSGPGIRPATRITDPVTLADVAPTSMRALGTTITDVDGVDLAPAFSGASLAARELYAESFAPLIEFGWAPLRALRSGPWKYIAAPRAELYDVGKDAGEQTDLVAEQSTVARGLDQRVARYSPASPPSMPGMSSDAAERLRALGYTAGSASDSRSALRTPQSAMSSRPDPKDKRDVAARLAQVTSGELTGAALLAALDGLVRDDPKNSQARLRLAYARLEAGDCARAEPEFRAAIAGGLPGADAHLGLASCQGRRKDLTGAGESLAEARRREPDNPVVGANLGILQAARGELSGAAASLEAALAVDPGLDEARFNLAIVYAKLNKRSEAAAAARELLRRLPASAPQRPEVERLLKAVQ